MGRVSMAEATVLLIGPLPPPIFGMATTNEAVAAEIRRRGVEPIVINLAGPTLERTYFGRFRRLPVVLGGAVRMCKMMPRLWGGTLYMSVSGGFGQVYELIYVLLGRLFKMRLYVRHCSFAYLDAPSRMMMLFTRMTGPAAVHIVQCSRMATRLGDLYGVRHVLSISNAVLYREIQNSKPPVRAQLKTLGFISNICREKGIFEFIDLISSVVADGLDVQALIAGPFMDADTEREVRSRLAGFDNVRYLGAVYGDSKDEFFRAIDVLVFPTKYRDETEAKVNHEAMRRNIPIIAHGRGCIPDIVDVECGLVVDVGAEFVPAAIQKIREWMGRPDLFCLASEEAGRRFKKTQLESNGRWRELIDEVVSRREAR